MISKTLVSLALAAGVTFSATPAMASDAGLYGKGDPTYDGVYRQSLAILALKATGEKIPADAIAWLKSQQCSSGGFVEYKPSAKTPCPAPDPANLIGPELNGTALAVAALQQTENAKPARKAVRWILGTRNSDGGYSYYPGPGATSDTASTALAIAAAKLVGKKTSSKYLARVQKRCEAPAKQRGGLSFDTALPDVNDGASAQTALLLGGALTLPKPVPITKGSPSLKCTGATKDKASIEDAALGYINTRLTDRKGKLPYGGGYPGTDYAGTASAALALALDGSGRKAVKMATNFLSRNAEDWITGSGSDAPGSIAMLILLARATGENPRDFDGMNLVKRLKQTRQS